MENTSKINSPQPQLTTHEDFKLFPDEKMRDKIHQNEFDNLPPTEIVFTRHTWKEVPVLFKFKFYGDPRKPVDSSLLNILRNGCEKPIGCGKHLPESPSLDVPLPYDHPFFIRDPWLMPQNEEEDSDSDAEVPDMTDVEMHTNTVDECSDSSIRTKLVQKRTLPANETTHSSSTFADNRKEAASSGVLIGPPLNKRQKYSRSLTIEANTNNNTIDFT